MENNENDINNIHISIVDNQNQNQFSNNFGNSSLTFPVFCTFCKKSPLFQPIFYCKECKFIYCSECEQYNGSKHNHPLYQIKNSSQYEFLNIGKPNEMDQFFDNVGNKVESAYKSILNFFGVKPENNEENNNNNSNNNENENNDNELDNPYFNQSRI